MKKLTTTALTTTTNTLVTTDKKSVKNTDKINRTITIDDIYKVFVTAVDGKPCKLNFSNAKSQQYCGLPSFSVNMKKTGFYVYMNIENASLCGAIHENGKTGVLNAIDNLSDNTKNQLRCKLVKFTFDQYDILCDCINRVVKNQCIIH